MFATILAILEAGLSLWESKERRKYVDKAMELRRLYYEEENKPDGERSRNRLDNIEFELRNLALGFAADARKQIIGDKP